MIVSVTITNSRAHEIRSAITSVIDQVDKVLIVDTGIEDNTLAVVEKVAGKKMLAPMKHAWRDFSAARNFGLNAARSLGAAWIVVVDTDECLDWGPLSLRDHLNTPTADVLMVESGDAENAYPKERIIRAYCPAHYFGPTHEVLLGGSRDTLRGVVFRELPKSWEQLRQKAERDVALLEEFLKTHAYDGRWWHYLGQSYAHLERRDEAANAYGKAAALKSTGPEALWSAYQQAEQLFFLDRFQEAIQAAAKGLSASALNPECAWIAGVCAQKLGLLQEAAAWARIAISMGRQPRDHFRYLPAHYELPYDVLRHVLSGEEKERADHAFHEAKLARVGATDAASLDRVSVSLQALHSHRFEARNMLRPPKLGEFCPSISQRPILFGPPGGLHPMNPSLTWHRGKLLCNVRAVNYTMTGRQYHVRDPDGIARTENFLGWLSQDGSLRDWRKVEDLDPSPRDTRTTIAGYEDIRLVSLEGRLYGSATVCDRNSDRRLMARLTFSEEGDVEEAKVLHARQPHEKNWMPFIHEGEIKWVYALDPTVVMTERPNEAYVGKSPFELQHLRGGAVAPFDQGFLAVTHENIDANEGRIYLHRFVLLDRDMKVTRVTRSFVFQHYGIEFGCGLALDGDQIVVSYGLKDNEAWLAKIPVSELHNMPWMDP